jgi:hypothetical protein
MRKRIISFSIICGLLFEFCNSGYEQNIEGLATRKFCLNIEETQKRNTIRIGKGTLTLNKDMTFEIMNDSTQFSNIKGEWDLCCEASDWGNYIFKPENHIKQMSSLPEFEVKLNNKIFFLVFTSCN